MLKLFVRTAITLLVIGVSIGAAAHDRLGRFFADQGEQISTAKAPELTAEQIGEAAQRDLAAKEEAIANLKTSANLQRRQLMASECQLHEVRDQFSAKVERVRKLGVLAENACQSDLGDHISRAEWITERDREQAERVLIEQDLKSREADVARRKNMLREMDTNLANCMSRVHNVNAEISVAVADVSRAEVRDQLAGLVAATTGVTFGDSVNVKLTALRRMAIEKDARADGVLMGGNGINPRFSNAEIDAALGDSATAGK